MSQDLEAKFNESTDFLSHVSLGGILLSGILLFTPVKSVGYIGIGGGIGTFVASVATKKKCLRVAQEEIDKVGSHQRVELSLRDELLLEKDSEIVALKGDVSKAFNKIKTLNQQLEQVTKLQEEINAFNNQNQVQKQLVEQITGELDRSISWARTAVEESIDEWNKRLSTLVCTKRETYPKLAQRLAELFDEAESKLAEYGLKLAQTPSKWESLPDLLSLYYCVNDDLANVKTKMIQALARLSTQEKELELQEIAETLDQWQSADLIPRDKVKALVAKYEAMLAEFRLDLNNRFENVCAIASNMEGQLSADEEFFLRLRMQIQRLEDTVATLQAKLNEAHQIKIFDDIGWKSEVANKVLHHFQLNEIVCDACPLPIREVRGDLEFYLTPRTRLGMNLIKADVEKVAESLRIPLGVKYVKVSLDGKNIKIRLPFEDREVKKASPEDVLNRPVSLWGSYLGSEYHRLIFAATQSGKTLLADELNGLQYTQLGGEIEFNAYTLKNDGNRDEGKERRFAPPTFKTSTEYMEALGNIHQAIAYRNSILQVSPNHRFPRQVFQLDEYGEFYRLGTPEEKSVGKEAVISLLQRGAGLSSETGKGISLTLIAQNPYVSQLGLFRPDLANACIIIVGEKNIRLFLDSDPGNHGLDEDDLDRLKSELKIFKEASRIASDKASKEAQGRGEDIGLAVRKCQENYYSLIIPSKGGLPPIIVYNPKPGEFTNGLIKGSESTAKPSCPDCKTTSDRRKGTSERYYCDNKVCKRQTFTWKGLA